MKHLLPMIIATIAVFAFLGVVIYTGELQIGEPEPDSYHLSLDYTSIVCSSEIGEVTVEPELQKSKTFHKWSLQKCKDGASCTVNSREFYESYGDTASECTDEITISAKCAPVNDPLADAYMKTYYLYEGQEATLSCP